MIFRFPTFSGKRSRYALIAAVLGLFVALPVFAQAPDLGLGFATATGLTTTDVRTLVGNIIKGFLGLLGLVAVGLLIYAGFLWMTSKGEEEQVTKAKRIILNAVIGLVIIIASYAIVAFIFRAVVGGAGLGGPDGECPVGQTCTTQCIGCDGGGSVLRVQGITPSGSGPSGNGWPKNYGFTVQFSGQLETGTVNESTFVVRKCGARTAAFNINDCSPGNSSKVVAGTRLVQGGSVTFKPSATPGDQPTDFEPDFWYLVRAVGSEIRDTQARTLTCPFASGSAADPASSSVRSDLCDRAASFGDFRDVEQPTASISQPQASARFCPSLLPSKLIPTQAEGRDDFMVARLDYRLATSDGREVQRLVSSSGVILPTPVRAINNLSVNPFSTGEISVDASTLAEGVYNFSVTPHDGIPSAGNPAIASFIINPPHCCNAVRDTDKGETGIDCGATSGCGACTAGDCSADADCSTGTCDAATKKCVERPVITSVTPAVAGPGSLVTIRGMYFGATPGSVVFLGAAGDPDDRSAQACAPSSWKQNADGSSEAIIAVPPEAKDGPLRLITASRTSDDTDVAPGWQGSFDVNAVVTPGICSLNPNSALAGALFVVNGSGFGAQGSGSRVNFGSSDASIASGGWEATQIAAVVPAVGNSLYDVTVSVGSQLSNPAQFAVAPAPDQSKPAITEVVPSAGPIGTFVTLRGSGFGSTPGKVRLANGADVAAALPPESCGTSWTPNYVVVKVPSAYSLSDQNKSVASGTRNGDTVSGVAHAFEIETSVGAFSNKAAFSVDLSGLRPGLCSITPDNGPPGTAVTVTGEGFGSGPGSPTALPRYSVEFYLQDGGTCLAGGSACTNIGGACGTSSVCVPRAFTAVNYGSATDWSDRQVSVFVPGTPSDKASWPKTGPVYVIANNQVSANSIPFKVQNCNETANACAAGKICCANGACLDSCPRPPVSSYGWRFSTEVLPTLPIVIERQLCDGVGVQSPSPFKDSVDACKNSGLQFEFSRLMKHSSFVAAGATATMLLESCGAGDTANCASATAVALGAPRAVDGNGTTVVQAPVSGLLQKNTWYRVTLVSDVAKKLGVTTVAGIYLDGDVDRQEGGSYVYFFKTKDTDLACALDRVAVLPAEYNIDHQGLPVSTPGNPDPGFLAGLFAANCNPLSCNAAVTDAQGNVTGSAPFYNIAWRVSDNGPTTAPILAPTAAAGNCMERFPVTASFETVSGNFVTLAAAANLISDPGLPPKAGTAKVSVKFADPVVTEHAPLCSEACVNADIYAKFNIPMDSTSFSGNGELFKCRNASCLPPFDAVSRGVVPIDEAGKTVGVSLTGPNLLPNTFYLVRLRGGSSGIKSASDVQLKGLNDGNYFSWTFKTKDSDVPCAVRRVTSSPLTLQLRYIGERAQVNAVPYGAPDSCNANGQVLQASAYDWLWTKTGNGVVSGFVVPSLPAPFLSLTGDLDTGVVGATACTDRCLNVGSRAATAQCGNGKIDKGEDCDDGNAVNGDGCSDQCLNEGATAGGDLLFAENANRLSQPDDMPTVTPYGGATVTTSADALKGRASAQVRSVAAANADGNYGGVSVAIAPGALQPGWYQTLSFLAKNVGSTDVSLHASIQNTDKRDGLLSFDTGNLSSAWTRYSFSRQNFESKTDILIWSEDANATWLVDDITIANMNWLIPYNQVVKAEVGKKTCGNGLIEPSESCDKSGSPGIFPPGCVEPNPSVSTSRGCVFSGSVALSCVLPTQSLVASWSGDNTTIDSVSGNNLTLVGGAGYAAGRFNNQGLSFDGLNDFAERVTASSALSGSNGVVVDWGTPAAPNNQSYGQFSPNGPQASNVKVAGADPFGTQSVLWESKNTAPYLCTNTTDARGNPIQHCINGPSGGWNFTRIPVDNNKEYRSSIWIKRTGSKAAGYVYHGLDGGNTNNLDGVIDRNPYMIVVPAAELTLNKWYLFVGYVHAQNDPSRISKGAVYDGVTKKKFADAFGLYDGNETLIPRSGQYVRDFKLSGATLTQTHRTYNYYDTDPATIQYFWGPRFEELNASTPSVQDLLNDQPNTRASIQQGLIGLSVEGWVKYAGAADDKGTIISQFKHSNGSDTDDSFFFGIAPGSGTDVRLRWQVNTRVGSGNPISNIFATGVPAALRDGSFHHLAATYNGSMMRIFMDGKELGNGLAASGTVNASSSPVRLGATSIAAVVGQAAVADDWFFKGVIDNLKVYNRGLTADDIDTIYSDALGLDCARGKAGRCGDSQIGDGESCDDGNTVNGDGCSTQCLNEGAPAQGTVGSGYCGDGRNDPGEDLGCEGGAGPAGNGCDAKTCLKNGTDRCTVTNTDNCCGNTALDPGEMPECVGTTIPAYCTERCLLKGSSISYGQPSACRDGSVGSGEVNRCEAAPAGGDGRKDGSQYVQAGAPAMQEGQAALVDTVTTTVTSSATQPAIPAGDQGKTQVSMSCTCRDTDLAARTGKQPQQFCADLGTSLTPALALGCTAGGCCAPPPKVERYYPLQNQENVCRNTAIRIVFDTPMDAASAVSKIMVGEAVTTATCGKACENDLSQLCTNDNECGTSKCVDRVRLSVSADDAVSTDGHVATQSPGLLRRAWNKVTSFFKKLFGGDASAATPPNALFCQVSGSVSLSGQVATFTVAKSLKPSTWHRISVAGGENGIAAVNGVTLPSPNSSHFLTGADICALESVSVTPPSYLFSASEDEPATLANGEVNPADETDGDKEFEALAMSRGGSAQIVSTPEFGFKWDWTEPADSEPIQIGPPNHVAAPVKAGNGYCEEGELTSSVDCAINLANVSAPKPAPGCGNNVCEGGTETVASCPSDCQVPPGENAIITVRVRSTAKGVAATQGQSLLRVTAQTSERGVVKSSLNGSADVTVMLCKNPWPKRRTCQADGVLKIPPGFSVPLPWDPTNTSCPVGNPGLVWYPFYDSATDVSFYYCRDGQAAGAEEPLLPEIDEANVVRIQPGRDIVFEYLFTFAKDPFVGGRAATWTKDALGLRVSQNGEHVSPRTWYDAQLFRGSPNTTFVGGYSALQEGRTVYVNAGAKSDASNKLFTNVNVLSYSDGAAPQSVAIFNQLLENIDFNANIKETKVCLAADGEQVLSIVGGSGTAEDPYVRKAVSCSNDLDCRNDAQGNKLSGHERDFCDSPKSKFQRDVKRWEDLQQSRATLLRSPGGQFPTLQSGSYLRAQTNSRWDSWGDQLRKEAGIVLPKDPVNEFAECSSAKPAGLIGWWPGDENAQNRVGEIGGVASGGMAYLDGKIGKAFAVNGKDALVRIPNDPALQPGRVTVEAWVKAANVDPNKYIVGKALRSGTFGSYALYSGSNGGLSFYVANGSFFVSSPSLPPTFWDGNFHHVAGTYDGNAVRLYADGELVGANAASGAIVYGGDYENGDLFIGSYGGPTSDNQWTGVIDEVAVYNDALSPAKIKTIATTAGKYDAATCWNASDRLFQCPVDSHVYEYQSAGGKDFTLRADFEAVQCAQYDTKASCDAQQGLCGWSGTTCASSVKWSGTTCMERAVAGCTDACAVVGAGCQNAVGKIEIGGLNRSQVCSGDVVGADGVCGDGIVQPSNLEQCEPGAKNDVQSCQAQTAANPPVTYVGLQERTCAVNCIWNGWGECRIGRCGDGITQVPEVCDDGDSLNGTYGHCAKSCASKGFNCGDKIVQPNESCDDGDQNGQYNKCAWDCSGPGPRCGDNVTNGSEVCDGNVEEYKGVCSNNSAMGCDADGDCPAGGACSVLCPTPEQKKKRTCKPPGDASACGGWSAWACTEPGACGNGILETGEECDDGIETGNEDACVIDPTRGVTSAGTNSAILNFPIAQFVPLQPIVSTQIMTATFVGSVEDKGIVNTIRDFFAF